MKANIKQMNKSVGGV